MTNSYPNVIVCLPAYNEIGAIGRMIDEIREQNFEVIVTDGGSTDGTKEKALAKQVVVLERPGKGKGYGMRQAINYASDKGYEVIVFLDCDMTYPINRIADLVKLAQNADMVIGARNYNMMPLAYKLANIFFTHTMSLLNGVKMKDTQSGMRALRVAAFKDIITVEGMEVEIELLSKALQRKYVIHEILVDYHPRTGESKVFWSDAFVILYRIFVCRFFR